MSDAQRPGITGDILLEAGTNEVEILAFRLGERSFGVNVAKVREVIRTVPVKDVPHKHPSVVGLFEIRGKVLTLIDLAGHLGIRPHGDYRRLIEEEGTDASIVVTEFNGVQIGFLIDAVDRIHRVSWSQVLPVPKLSVDQDDAITVGVTTGVVPLDERLVLLVDFESVADAILMEKKLNETCVPNEMDVDRASKTVFIAEDSPFMRSQIVRIMRGSGYEGVQVFQDGVELWEALEACTELPDAIVSDIEMPRMDGLALTKRIKSESRYQSVPVVLFSSLVSEDNANKGRAVGATVQIPKPELPDLVRLVDRIVSGESVEGMDFKPIRLAAA